MENNIFINFIYNKRVGKFIGKFTNWLSYKIFLHDLKKASPDFGMLWQFADFIKMVELSAWFDNAKYSYIFSSKEYAIGENGFIIFNEALKYKIIIKLFSKDESIQVEVKRDYGHRTNSSYTIRNRDVNLPTETDQILMLNIIRDITNNMSRLLKEQYQNA